MTDPPTRSTAPAPTLVLLLWLAATVLIVVVFHAIGWTRVARIEDRVESEWLLMAVCGNLAIQPFAAIQWLLLLPAGASVHLRRMLKFTALSSLAMSTTPPLVGHASSVMLLARQPGVGHGTALSVFALEQLTEGLAKLSVLVLAIVVLPVPRWMQHAAIVLACVVMLALVAMLVAAHHHGAAVRWASRSGHRSLAAFVARWTERLETLRTPHRFLGALLACHGMKLVEGLAIIATQQALGIDLPASYAILVLAAAGLGTMLPVAPGSIGTYEAAVILAYKWLGLSTADAVALAIVQHVAYLAASTGAGYAILSLRQVRAWRRAA